MLNLHIGALKNMRTDRKFKFTNGNRLRLSFEGRKGCNRMVDLTNIKTGSLNHASYIVIKEQYHKGVLDSLHCPVPMYVTVEEMAKVNYPDHLKRNANEYPTKNKQCKGKE